jgi:hypothetical protein
MEAPMKAIFPDHQIRFNAAIGAFEPGGFGMPGAQRATEPITP